MDVSYNRYLSNNFAPVREETTAYDLPVVGKVPPELNGRLLRIGPNPLEDVDRAWHHWFSGSGMVHGLRLRDGRALWYRSRFVIDGRSAHELNRPDLPGPRNGDGPNVVNTNVIGHAGKLFTLVEAGSLPVELSADLDPIARSDLDGTLPGGFTAHPKRDPVSGLLHAITYSPHWDFLRYLVVDGDAHVSRSVDIPVAGHPLVHDLAFTENYIVVFDLPVTLKMDGPPSSSFPYEWNEDHQPRVGLMPREKGAGAVRWFEVPSCFLFHAMNAFEDGDRVIVDFIRHQRMFVTDLNGPDECVPMLARWIFDLKMGRVAETLLDDCGTEFPRINETRIGRSYDFGYTAHLGKGVEHGPSHKHHLRTGRTETHEYGHGRSTLEPVFIPRRR